jgi:predicted RNase H-like HicB family nuclease
MMSKKDLNYYMNLPYKIEIIPEEDGTGFNAVIPDLKGCMAFGETSEEALETLNEVKQIWIEAALDRGWRIPEPIIEEREYSGKFNVRIPPYLHRDLVKFAENQNTSLNQLVLALLSEGLERKRRPRQPRTVKPFSREEFALLTAQVLSSLSSTTRPSESTEKKWSIPSFPTRESAGLCD